jgi:hypothetical protein
LPSRSAPRATPTGCSCLASYTGLDGEPTCTLSMSCVVSFSQTSLVRSRLEAGIDLLVWHLVVGRVIFVLLQRKNCELYEDWCFGGQSWVVGCKLPPTIRYGNSEGATPHTILLSPSPEFCSRDLYKVIN